MCLSLEDTWISEFTLLSQYCVHMLSKAALRRAARAGVFNYGVPCRPYRPDEWIRSRGYRPEVRGDREYRERAAHCMSAA